MTTVDKEVWLEAPIERIFSYINEPSNHPEYWPSLMEVNNVKSLPNGGYSFRWAYKMLGRRFAGTAECTEILPNQLLIFKTTGGIKSTIWWTFRSRNNKTRVTFTAEYKVPIPLLGKLAEAIIVKMNDHEGDLIMSNLQAKFMTDNHQNSLSLILADF